MIKVYVNYPNKKISIHADPTCPAIQQQHKEGQRVVKIDSTSSSKELAKFKSLDYRFAAEPKFNDMWLIVELINLKEEIELVERIRVELGLHYSPFRQVNARTHCGLDN